MNGVILLNNGVFVQTITPLSQRLPHLERCCATPKPSRKMILTIGKYEIFTDNMYHRLASPRPDRSPATYASNAACVQQRHCAQRAHARSGGMRAPRRARLRSPPRAASAVPVLATRQGRQDCTPFRGATKQGCRRPSVGKTADRAHAVKVVPCAVGASFAGARPRQKDMERPAKPAGQA